MQDLWLCKATYIFLLVLQVIGKRIYFLYKFIGLFHKLFYNLDSMKNLNDVIFNMFTLAHKSTVNNLCYLILLPITMVIL